MGQAMARGPIVGLLLLLLLAVFGPLVASDVPLVARVHGSLRFPAVAEVVGAEVAGPGDTDWRTFAAELNPQSDDFVWRTLWPHGPSRTDLAHKSEGPSLAHPLGRDDTGRDLLARMIRGTRPVVGLAALGVLCAGAIGVLLGGLAGLRRGLVDVLVLRAIEIFLCFPTVLLLMALAALFGESSLGVVAVFALTMWPSFARVVRGHLLSLREREFVQAARGLGIAEGRILLRHLLPQVRGPVGVTAAFCMGQAVVAESTLSFLGLGPGPQSASWGSILMQGKQGAHLGVWHLWLFPALAILGTVLVCHALAERKPAR
jgi:peptide/nickel transport system permease protein